MSSYFNITSLEEVKTDVVIVPILYLRVLSSEGSCPAQGHQVNK